MLEKLASVCHRRRWFVIAIWITAAIGISLISGSSGGSSADGGRLQGTDSDKAYQVLAKEFPTSSGGSAMVVFRDPAGVSKDQPGIDAYLAKVRTLHYVAAIGSPFASGANGQISKDGTTAFATVDFTDGVKGDVIGTTTAKDMATAATQLRAGTVQVEFRGPWFIDGRVPSSEVFGLLAAVVILLIAFGSVVAMGLPIATAILGIIIGLAGVSLWANVFDTPDFTVQVASMVGIGVGIDYALFIVTRYRDAQQRGLSSEASVIEAIGTAGRAVAFAGCTVVISLLGMILMGLPFLYGLAVGTSSAVLVAVVAALTLIPALLGVMGRHLDRLSVHRRHRTTRETMWHRWSRLVQRLSLIHI